jgi:hypothetical protein
MYVYFKYILFHNHHIIFKIKKLTRANLHIYSHFGIFSFFFFWWYCGLNSGKQMLRHLGFGYFSDRVLNFCVGLALDQDSPTYACLWLGSLLSATVPSSLIDMGSH